MSARSPQDVLDILVPFVNELIASRREVSINEVYMVFSIAKRTDLETWEIRARATQYIVRIRTYLKRNHPGLELAKSGRIAHYRIINSK